jgi:galactokinase
VRASQWQKAGDLMYASHRSLRDDYEVSCAELDAIVEIAEGIGLKGGVYGCRMTGGGFGGCAVALVKSDSVAAISRTLADAYQKKTGLAATIFGSRPAAGATIIKA